MKRIQQLHLWLGVLFAPLIILFALSGALQTFNWHEGQKNGPYQPPAWIQHIAAIHQHQRFNLERGVHASLALKWFVVFMSIGLIATTGLGIYMAFKYQRNRWVVWGLIAAGIALPALCLLF